MSTLSLPGLPRRAFRAVVLIAALTACAAATANTKPDPGPQEVPAPGKVSSSNKKALKPMIDGIAKRRGLDVDLVHAVIAAESGYNPRAVSPAGALGLMQVMPDTAADYGVDDPQRLFDPETNVDVGTRHLKRLIGKYGNIPRAVAAYNAGEGALERNNAAVAYPETRHYSQQVLGNYMKSKGRRPADLKALGLGLTPIVIRSTITNLDPGLHRVGPDSKPMFVLEVER